MPRWPHAPLHLLGDAGVYIVTGATHGRVPYFEPPERRTMLQDRLLETADHFGWRLQSWAVIPDHYHFMAESPGDATTLSAMVGALHSSTARWLNERDGTPGRRVWHQYWESQITFQRSYMARLGYVNRNPVKHGLARVPSEYPWCSAAWLKATASPEFVRAVASFKVDRVSVVEPGEPRRPRKPRP